MTNHLTSAPVISGMSFEVAGEVLSVSGILNETRQYNALFQLTRLTQTSGGTTVLDRGFTYTANQNTDKIASEIDFTPATWEAVAYTYDSLNRLASAQTTQGAIQ